MVLLAVLSHSHSYSLRSDQICFRQGPTDSKPEAFSNMQDLWVSETFFEARCAPLHQLLLEGMAKLLKPGDLQDWGPGGREGWEMLILDCVPTSRTPQNSSQGCPSRETEAAHRPHLCRCRRCRDGDLQGLPVSVLGHPLHHRGDKSEDLHGLGQPILATGLCEGGCSG